MCWGGEGVVGNVCMSADTSSMSVLVEQAVQTGSGRQQTPACEGSTLSLQWQSSPRSLPSNPSRFPSFLCRVKLSMCPPAFTFTHFSSGFELHSAGRRFTAKHVEHETRINMNNYYKKYHKLICSTTNV